MRGCRVWRIVGESRLTTLAGSLVFFLAMSLLPLFFWLMLLCGRNGSGLLQVLISRPLFSWAEDAVSYLQRSAEEAAGNTGILFLATTLWSGTGFFYHFRRIGELLYGCGRQHRGWRARLMALVVTVALLFYFAVCSAVLVAAGLLTGKLPAFLSAAIFYTLVLLFGFFAAWALNAYACPYRRKAKTFAAGSFLTAVSWLLSSMAFSVYLRFSSPEKLYGALSIAVVFALWLYWMMLCLAAGIVFHARKDRYLIGSDDAKKHAPHRMYGTEK